MIHSGRIEDIAEILNHLIAKISWYPKTLVGEVHGSVDVSGKLSTPKLIIHSELEGSDWSWLGERASRVKLHFGYDEGIYTAKNVNMIKTSGGVHGDIEFDSNRDFMRWNMGTQNITLLDLDFIDRLQLPAKSKIEVKSQGEGLMSHLVSHSEIKVTGTEIKGEKFEPSRAALDIGENLLRGNLEVFGGKASGQMKYALNPKQPSSFRVDLNDFDFSSALLILNPKLLDDPELEANITGHLQLDFLSTQSEFARGEIQLSQYELKKTGFTLRLVDPVYVPIQLGYFHFPA